MQPIKLHKSLKYILPYKTKDLVRLGNKCDSGYVISRKALRNVNFLISFGMSNNWSFEENFLKLNSKNKIHIYDHTVGYKFFLINFIRSIKRMFYFKSNFENIFNKLKDLIGYYYIKNNSRVKHLQIKVSNKNFDKEENLQKIFSKVKNKKILLSIDIEGDEYKVINNIIKYDKLIHLLIVEFHFIDKKKSSFKKIITNLKRKFDIIHIHGNNYTSYCKDGMPITLEITMRNKKFYPIKKKYYVKDFPNKKVDFPNLKNQKDLRFSFPK